MCEDRIRNPSVFQPVCAESYCSDGCLVACSFQKPSRGSAAAASVTWQFKDEIQTDTDFIKIFVSWLPPVPSLPVSHPPAIVYTLLMREDNDAWKFLGQTKEERFTLDHDDAGFVPEFLLQAIDDSGIIASSLFHVKQMIFSNVIQPMDYGELRNLDDSGEERRPARKPRLQPKVNLTFAVSYDASGGLRAWLNWTHAPDSLLGQARPQLLGGPAGSADDELVMYELVLIMEKCGIYDDVMPQGRMCEYPEDLSNSMVPVWRSQMPTYTVSELLFNSRYVVTVLVESPGNSASHVDLAQVVMETPRCDQPRPDYRRCEVLTALTTQSPPADVSSNVTVTSNNVTVASNDTRGEGSDDASLQRIPELIRDVTVELIRDVTVELLPDPDHYDHYDDDNDNVLVEADDWSEEEDAQVLVNVSWTFFSDASKVNFSLTLISAAMDQPKVLEVAGVTFVAIRLQDNTVYDLMIEVIAPPEVDGDVDRLFGWQDRNYLENSRKWKEFNTSELQLATSERHQAVRMSTAKNVKAVNGVIIGVTCVGAIMAMAIIGVFLYKKRQAFKGIIIPKTTVAKSNSYKSSVGVKADYSNQLMVFCDEWELDPQQLKFSTPLGQGAFGKVVTGYYVDHRVAIKLVKEGAPLSYKEDLVAEINLMKRLGTHPNIVCLVGACTVTEPIALVMEYVPFGNLQNFLKKCRLEGDLQKRANGPSEIVYSMLQDCGGLENGVITPTDMLSFARQVAMAMEYLTDKKYVHRDLAARNVLLHFHKVVKVCDFGLSRDIFNDNQYKKLTNGKLPLKWMAIESLRDRIFTTQSDVWSFGILLWEIVTMGASPYPSIALADLYYVLSNHYRMDKPSNCSNELYALMRSCWAESPLERPTFTELREQLEDLMAEDRDYLVLEDIDVPLSASESSSNPTALELFSGEMMPSQAARQAVTSSFSASSDSGSSASAVLLRHHRVPGGVPVGGGGGGGAGCGGALLGATGGGAGTAVSGASAAAASLTPLTSLTPASSSSRHPHMTIDVCIHQKSTERLMRPSESDSSP